MFICIWPILLPTLDSSLKLDPLVDSAIDLNPSISQDITDSLPCHLDMGDERVGLLDQDHLWCRTRVDRELEKHGIHFSYGYQPDIYLDRYLFLRHSGTVLD